MLESIKDSPYEIYKVAPSLPNGYETISKDHKIKKPTVLVLGGNFTFTGKHAYAMGKIAANLLGLKEKKHKEQIATYDDVDILAVAYGRLKYAENTVLNDDELVEVCNRLFVPMVVDDGGNRLPLEEAMKNASMLTMFNHCYGSRVADELTLEFMTKLGELGYDADETHKIMSQISAVSFAPMNNIHCGPHMKVHSYEDMVIPEGLFHGPKALNGIAVVKGRINDFIVWTSRLANGIRANIDEHCVSRIHRNENWKAETKVHHIKTYIGKNADAVSQMMSYVLAELVANSLNNYYSKKFTPKPSVDYLVAGCKDIQSSYKDEELSMN